jgi:hypothetical protein
MGSILKRNLRFYMGSKCCVCGKPVTINNKSGYCNRCRNRSQTQDTKDKIRLSKMGSRNPNWVGDKVSYNQLHDWVRKRIPKPSVCPKCKKNRVYDLCNKGRYVRDLDQWEWLCRRCHMLKDGRLDKLILRNKNL